MSRIDDLKHAIVTNEAKIRKAAAPIVAAYNRNKGYIAELARLEATPVAVPAVSATVPAVASTGPLTHAQISAAYDRFVADPAWHDPIDHGTEIEIANRLGINRELAAQGLFSEPGTYPDVDYSAYTNTVSDGTITRGWVNGELIFTHDGQPTDADLAKTAFK